jgi:hypothetical protein
MMSEAVFQQDLEVKAMLEERWLGERVTLEGLLMVTQHHPNPKFNHLTTKIEDVTVILPNKEKHHLSHTWIQKSETLKDVPEGTKIRFTATIKTYHKRDGTTSVGFHLPFNCEVLTAAALATAKAVPTQPPTGNVVMQFTALLAKAKSEMDRLGGSEALKQLLPFLG